MTNKNRSMRNVIKRSLNSNSHASPDEEFLARKKEKKRKRKREELSGKARGRTLLSFTKMSNLLETIKKKKKS